MYHNFLYSSESVHLILQFPCKGFTEETFCLTVEYPELSFLPDSPSYTSGTSFRSWGFKIMLLKQKTSICKRLLDSASSNTCTLDMCTCMCSYTYSLIIWQMKEEKAQRNDFADNQDSFKRWKETVEVMYYNFLISFS